MRIQSCCRQPGLDLTYSFPKKFKMCVLFCHIFTMIFVEFQSLITKFLQNSYNGYLFLHWLTDLHIHFLSIWILSNISGEKKECMCLFSCWYVDFLLLSLKRASLKNICVALGVDLLKTSPARVKISLVVAQNGHWFVDFLWMSLVEKLYVWLLVLTCSKRVQWGPQFH